MPFFCSKLHSVKLFLIYLPHPPSNFRFFSFVRFFSHQLFPWKKKKEKKITDSHRSFGFWEASANCGELIRSPGSIAKTTCLVCLYVCSVAYSYYRRVYIVVDNQKKRSYNKIIIIKKNMMIDVVLENTLPRPRPTRFRSSSGRRSTSWKMKHW